ncbi:unnamed protein product, partial [marine sediment metagenome]
KGLIFYMPEKLYHQFKTQVAKDKKAKDMSKVCRNLIEAYTEKKLNCKGETQ